MKIILNTLWKYSNNLGDNMKRIRLLELRSERDIYKVIFPELILSIYIIHNINNVQFSE